jgi:hypothetical protein
MRNYRTVESLFALLVAHRDNALLQQHRRGNAGPTSWEWAWAL